MKSVEESKATPLRFAFAQFPNCRFSSELSKSVFDPVGGIRISSPVAVLHSELGIVANQLIEIFAG
jgi:hypothetical protein